MSGIVGSKFNHRGSGLVGSLGTDGQHLLSSGAGVTNVFETVAGGGGKILQVQHYVNESATSIGNSTSYTSTAVSDIITPSADSSKILVIMNVIIGNYAGNVLTTGSSNILVGYEADARFGHSGEGSSSFPSTCVFVDSPSTTDACTYTWYMAHAWNNDAGDSANTGPSSLDSSVTLMEIDGS